MIKLSFFNNMWSHNFRLTQMNGLLQQDKKDNKASKINKIEK